MANRSIWRDTVFGAERVSKREQPLNKYGYPGAVYDEDSPIEGDIESPYGGSEMEFFQAPDDYAFVPPMNREVRQPTREKPRVSDEYRDAVAQRLGHMRVLAARPYERKDYSVTAASVAKPDSFLRGDRPGYSGGVERGNPAGNRMQVGNHGSYDFEEPNADRRDSVDDLFRPGFNESSPVADASQFRPYRDQAAMVGGVPVKKSTRPGTFTSWLRSVTSQPTGFECE